MANYDNYFVAYLDILGFKEMVLSKSEGAIANLMRRVDKTIREAKDQGDAKIVPNVEVSSLIVSDSIFVAIPYPETGSKEWREKIKTFNYPDYSGKFIYDDAETDYSQTNYLKPDGPMFVHYLNRIGDKDKTKQVQFMTNLKTNLYSAKDERTFAKYRWVIEYLSTFVDDKMKEELDKL